MPTEAPTKPASVGSAVPSSAGEIHVTAPTSPTPPPQATPPQSPAPKPVPPPEPTPPGKRTALERIGEELDKKFGSTEQPAPLAKPPAKETSSVDEPLATDAQEGDKGPDEPQEASDEAKEGEQPKEGEKPAEKPAKAKKPNPWRMVDEYKVKVKQLEDELVKAKTGESPLAEQERKELTERNDKTAARLRELEDEIRFVNYEKSEEFAEKHQKPWDAAWARAVDELKGVPVIDAEDNTREATWQDLYQLVMMDTGQARTVAKAAFGDFASDVMDLRKEIRSLHNQRQMALTEAREKGAEREKAKMAEVQREQAATKEFIAKAWNDAQREQAEHPEFGKIFNAPEDDSEAAELLDKGRTETEEAMARNAFDPSLSKEEKVAVLRKQAALRYRAAAFERLLHDISTRDSRITELERELAVYQTTTPPAGGSTPPAPAASAPASRMDRMSRDLEEFVARRSAH